ncbi:MAG: histidine kinase [Fervidobacterium sp.]|nr:histidine kinase [Fervidobacterium sp.]
MIIKKLNNNFRKWLIIELLGLSIFIIFLFVVNFKSFLAPFMMSVVLVNLSAILFNLFRKIYENQRNLTKKITLDILNVCYSLFLCINSLISLLNILAFRRNRLYAENLFTLVLLVISVIFALYVLRLKQAIELERANRQSLENYTKFLKSQFDPHFLFNVLNSLAELVRKSPEESEKVIIHLSEYYRAILKSPQMWSISEEIEFIKKYIELQKSILTDIAFDYSISSSILSNDIKIPAFILQPLVENAIKYGIRKNLGGFIKISVDKNDNEIRIDIENNVSEKVERITFGSGLTITFERLKLHSNGILQWNYSPNKSSITFTVKIPLQNNKKYK